jgi:hypothetical protein
MRVLRRYGLYCAHQAACYGRREPETRLRGGWCHVDKGAIGDGLRAGVAEDDLSEEALGAFCVPKGLARSRASVSEAKRNKCWKDPLCGEEAVYAGFALTLDRIKASPGGNRASIAGGQCGGVATHGTFQPRLIKGACGREWDPLWERFRGSYRSLGRWSGNEVEEASF